MLIADKTVGFEIEGETCIDGEVKANVTCTATFSGHNPPLLQLRREYDGHEGRHKPLSNGVVLTSPTAVHLITEVSGVDMTLTSHLVCAVTTPTSYIVLANYDKTSLTALYSGMQKLIYLFSWVYYKSLFTCSVKSIIGIVNASRS